MIDFKQYTLPELRAVSSVLSNLIDDIIDAGDAITMNALPFDYYRSAMNAEVAAIDQQARDHAAAEAEKVDRIKQACIAGAPPAEDPEPAPDMLGWVNDALDGLQV